jgi:rSAM/selenodomain-associated transferase 2
MMETAAAAPRPGAASRPQDAGARRPVISTVIPALDEEKAIPDVLEGLRRQQAPPAFEVILVDGGSADRTVPLFREAAAGWPEPGPDLRVVVSGRRGRSAQMNAGAGAARGEALLFLHADTVLPPGALAAVASALRDRRVAGGGFRHRFREPGFLLRIVSAWATTRSRLLRIHFGDQAMFVRRAVFEDLGGFEEVPLFEDLRLARVLRRSGRVVTLPLCVRTSSRRLAAGGVLRTCMQFAALRLRHALGVDPGLLRRGYPDVR